MFTGRPHYQDHYQCYKWIYGVGEYGEGRRWKTQQRLALMDRAPEQPSSSSSQQRPALMDGAPESSNSDNVEDNDDDNDNVQRPDDDNDNDEKRQQREKRLIQFRKLEAFRNRVQERRIASGNSSDHTQAAVALRLASAPSKT